VKEIANIVNNLFDDTSKIVTTEKISGLKRIKNSFCEVPELEEFFENTKLTETIESYYGGPFKIYSCDIFRTFYPCANLKENLNSSNMWHYDTSPNQLIKVFVYLSDVTKNNGATSIVPAGICTAQFKNYWNRFKQQDMWPEIDKYEIRAEAEFGSTLIFRPQHCLHKANQPQPSEYRDVAVFLLHPSLKKYEKTTPEMRLKYSRNFGYLYNPFTSRTIRYGEK
jgi:hypothetical protein